MQTNRNYLLVGLFVLVIIIAGFGFTLWLTFAGKGDYIHYILRFSESVSGLNDEGVVKFNGVDVGNVKEIDIDPDDIRLIRVNIQILKSTPIKTETRARLKLQGITGDMYIELSGGNKNSPDLVAKKNEIAEIPTVQSSVSTIVKSLPQALEKSKHIADQIDKMFSEKNVEAFNRLLSEENVESFNKLLRSLEEYVGD
jgi:phospholipid/cholesterol/gamma-HCH transport system substrate-binding protein